MSANSSRPGRGRVHQLPGNVTAQAARRLLEQLKSLALVLVERIALRIAAQANRLPQVLQAHEVLAPEMVERVAARSPSRSTHGLRSERGFLARGGRVRLILKTLFDFLVGDAFLGGPFLDGNLHGEDR